MKTAKIKAYAKINLTLEITGVDGGYHMLDSLVASVDLFDLVCLKKRKDKLSSVLIKGVGSDEIPPDNNALKAAEAFSERFGVSGAEITIYRNIPVGAGLGSSSADIAGVLKGMAKLYGIDLKEVESLAETLGCDTKYMLLGGFARMQGRGERLTPIDFTGKLHMLCICPSTGVSAGGCYRRYDEGEKPAFENATEKGIDALLKGDIESFGKGLKNDLYPPATALNPDVLKAYQEAESFSPLGVVMTGSGSAVLALFETKELCEWAKSRYKGKFKTYVLETVVKSKEIRNPFELNSTF